MNVACRPCPAAQPLRNFKKEPKAQVSGHIALSEHHNNAAKCKASHGSGRPIKSSGTAKLAELFPLFRPLRRLFARADLTQGLGVWAQSKCRFSLGHLMLTVLPICCLKVCWPSTHLMPSVILIQSHQSRQKRALGPVENKRLRRVHQITAL